MQWEFNMEILLSDLSRVATEVVQSLNGTWSLSGLSVTCKWSKELWQSVRSYAMATGFLLFFSSLDIWHHEQGPQKQAYTQSLQMEPCGHTDTVMGRSGTRQILCMKVKKVNFHAVNTCRGRIMGLLVRAKCCHWTHQCLNKSNDFRDHTNWITGCLQEYKKGVWWLFKWVVAEG